MKVSSNIKKLNWSLIRSGFFAASLLAIVGCAQNDQKKATDYPVDNSGRNLRDGTPKTPTPAAQGDTNLDVGITEKIRQELVADDSLSTNAKNIKVIAANGVVTLRGPVDSQQEKENIAHKASVVAGEAKIDNQLEVINVK